MELIVDGKNVLEPVNLEKNKNEIMRQRESVPSQVTLTHFKEEVGVFRANVKGDDLNGLVTKLQDIFSDINTRESKIYDQLDTVFETVESIHKGSIEGVIVGVRSAQEAISQAEYAIEQINETLLILQGFKSQLEDNTEHLNDIDIIWDATQHLNKDILRLENFITEKTKNIENNIKLLQDLMTRLDKIKHLNDVDAMHKDFYEHTQKFSKETQRTKSKLNNIDEKIDKIQESLKKLERFLDELNKQEHLYDIDDMWQNCDGFQSDLQKIENNSLSHENSIIEIKEALKLIEKYRKELHEYTHLSDIDTVWEKVQKDAGKLELLESEITTFKGKIKTLYYALGGAIGIVILQIILNMVGVL